MVNRIEASLHTDTFPYAGVKAQTIRLPFSAVDANDLCSGTAEFPYATRTGSP